MLSKTLRIFYIFFITIRTGVFFDLMAFACNRNPSLDAFGRRLTHTLQTLGPAFIKLGQFLSTRPDALGPEITAQLSKLQDSLPPFSYKRVKRTIEKSLGKRITDIFSSFDKTAFAAASIAQVHKAKTLLGQEVAVKVMRPKVYKIFMRDIAILRWIAFLVRLFSRNHRLFNLNKLADKFEEITRIEMNFTFEAASSDELACNLKDDNNVVIPTVFWEYSSSHVLTTKWIHGFPINSLKDLEKHNIDRKQLAQNLAVTFFNQAYRDGFFHADLHPGNILVTPEGKIALIDFGIMGTLSRKDRLFLAESMYGFICRDYQKVADLHFDIGYVPAHKSKHLFKLACRAIGEPIIGRPANQISVGKLLNTLLETGKRFDMKALPQLVLLQKTMITLEGIGITIYPEVNMWQLAEPWILKWGKENLSFRTRAKEASVDFFKNKVPEISLHLKRTLVKLEQYLDEKLQK